MLVAMSGGVDSSVAALLSGPQAVGVTLELWADPENDAEGSCCSAVAVRRARGLAHERGMPHFSIDLRAEFRAGVVEPWLAGHAAGLTPNPCVACNGRVRLHGMLDIAQRLGAEALATGHYARIESGLLRVAADPDKDQSYMLAALPPAQLRRVRFPLGELRKGEVRERARTAGLTVADAPDSQDLCFLAGTGRRRFLERHGGLAAAPGEVIDRRGTVLARHEGAHLFTVGQRRGLGLGGGPTRYVLATDPLARTVTVGSREELATRAISVRDAVLHRHGSCVDHVRLRYHSLPIPCQIHAPAGRHAQLEVTLLARAGAPAPGQSACLMAGELIVGEGTISARAR
ncbi:MAG TPA: tRNA 2-thiouridine(34) synthase MnmA [Solirubrobacteraceae bacterium]|nr:tRNA 2-thiouridine(34) synthase MnmA [Solirubrobacteraceae bacterium]